MSYNKTNNKEPENEPEKETYYPPTRTEIEQTQTWMNLSKSKKGIIIVMENDFLKGDVFTVPVIAVEALLSGQKTGVNIAKLNFIEK